MQVFVPYKNVLDIAKVMYKDYKRYNKQIIECKQIINANLGLSNAWKNHPVTLMYKDHIEWLKLYIKCFETYKMYIKSDFEIGSDGLINAAKEYSDKADKICPKFISNELCDQHKRRLYTKDKKLYSCFEQYGISDENWYIVNNKLIKYINGKKLK